MALNILEFEFCPDDPKEIPVERAHGGVTGSGDLEILIEKSPLGGRTRFKVCSPVVGFDVVWEKVLSRFVAETGIANVVVEINDDNATPIVVYMRLIQLLTEILKMGEMEKL